jgi:TPR repeat protein
MNDAGCLDGLALYYRHGIGVEQDDEVAIAIEERAAEAGYIKSYHEPDLCIMRLNAQ